MADTIKTEVKIKSGDKEMTVLPEEVKTQIETMLQEEISIDEVTVGLSIKRQAVKFEVINDYSQYVKLTGIGTAIKKIKNNTKLDTVDVSQVNSVISAHIIARTKNMFNFCKSILRDECSADEIPVRNLGKSLDGPK